MALERTLAAVLVPGLLVSLQLLLSIACAGGAGAGEVTPEDSPMTRTGDPEIDDREITRLVEGGNAFAFDLYEAAAEPAAAGGGNLFLSPYSVSTALTMTWAGARGETAREMAEVLRLDLPADRVHGAAAALRKRVGSSARAGGAGTPLELRVANALWGQEGVAFDPAFRELLESRYGAGLEPVDFVGAAERARAAINRWAEDETGGKIEELVPEGAVGSLTRLVLANAVYFKASWKNPFDQGRTAEAPFHLLGGGEVRVPMMVRVGSFPYHRGEGYAAVELPYVGGDAAMVVVVPDRPDPEAENGGASGDFGGLERSFGADALAELIGELTTTRVELALPRFEITSSAALGEALRELGMARAFGDSADFSGMVDPETDSEIARALYLSDVLHKAWVRVDEEGTEAAAASAATIAVTSMPMGEPVRLIVDRPFLFFIRHRPTGAILFSGRVLDPTG